VAKTDKEEDADEDKESVPSTSSSSTSGASASSSSSSSGAEKLAKTATSNFSAAGLDTQVTEGGSSLSSGERQLVTLARALLRRARVLMLDEHSSALDPHSAEMVQRAIDKHFKGCTVLTIAHNLLHVAHCDMIVVMEHGTVVETGSPSELLANPRSNFAGMVRELGS